MPNPGMYRGDRRRKEDQRKAKLEAKKARKAERRESGTAGPEIADQPESDAASPTEFVWFSPSKGRTLTTTSKAAPVVDGIDDWMLLSEPPPAVGG
ncbi:MAG: hypothetical protein ACREKJ_16820 [Candidatus Rokuibacteriota bacterium]